MKNNKQQTAVEWLESIIIDKNGIQMSDYFKFTFQQAKEMEKEQIEMYKECFERFIPIELWDEATNFLSTYGGGLAKDFSKNETYGGNK